MRNIHKSKLMQPIAHRSAAGAAICNSRVLPATLREFH
jgi:hypothetical protein